MKGNHVNSHKVTYTCPNLQFILLMRAYNSGQYFQDISTDLVFCDVIITQNMQIYLYLFSIIKNELLFLLLVNFLNVKFML